MRRQGQRQGFRFARVRAAHRSRPRRWSCACSTIQSVRKPGQARIGRRNVQGNSNSPLTRRHGLILVNRPDAARAKQTRTLYSALNELEQSDLHIVTVEDPVEFQIPGHECRPKKTSDFTFANALRFHPAPDPDIIMIGEIRDTEPPRLPLKPPLTGHQVLSTMHCNDAARRPSRASDDMGIAPF